MKKLALLSLSAIFLSGCVIGGISPEAAEKTSADFIKILAPGAEVSIQSAEKTAGGDFKIIVNANEQEVISYLSPDGTVFYPQGLNIAELTAKFEEFEKQQESVGTPPAEGEVMIPVEPNNEIGDGAESLDEVLEKAEEVIETATE